MGKRKEQQIKINVTLTEGYEQRFTEAVLKHLYEPHIRKQIGKEKNSLPNTA